MIDLLAAVLFVVLFGFFDYVAYNFGVKWKAVPFYRVAQYFVQAAMIAFLWDNVNFKAAFLFTWLWWCWLADLVYYFFYDTFGWFKEQGTVGNAFKDQVLGNKVTWAWWTPYGMVQTIRGKKAEPIGGNVLLAQAGAGLLIAIVIGVWP